MLLVFKDRMDAGTVPFYLASTQVGAVVPRLVEGVQTPLRINSVFVDNSRITEGEVTVTLYCSPV
jgi:hypothetical protein